MNLLAGESFVLLSYPLLYHKIYQHLTFINMLSEHNLHWYRTALEEQVPAIS